MKVSIVIPAYNYAGVLPRAVESVVAQLRMGYELIVIDDGSTDETPSVLARLEEKYPGRFRVITQSNRGLASVRNRGVEAAQAPRLLFLDADDELAPGAIDAIDAGIATHPEAGLLIGGYVSIEPDGTQRVHLPGRLPADPVARVRAYLIEKTIGLANGACVMHKKIFDEGGYPERFRSAEDLPVFAQALGNHVCAVLDAVIARIHKHEDSMRNQYRSAKATGMELVAEIFETGRLDERFASLRRDYYVQRNLSLFRSAYFAGCEDEAMRYFLTAFREKWNVVFNLSYSKKACRLLVGRFFRSVVTG